MDFEDLLLTVYGKRRKERRIPFSFELRKKLFRYEQLVQKRSVKFDLVFPTRNGTALTQRNTFVTSICCRSAQDYRHSAGIACDIRLRLSTCGPAAMCSGSQRFWATRRSRRLEVSAPVD